MSDNSIHQTHFDHEHCRFLSPSFQELGFSSFFLNVSIDIPFLQIEVKVFEFLHHLLLVLFQGLLMTLLVIILLLSPLVHQELAEIWSDGLILFEEHAIVAVEILFLSSLEFILHLNKLRVRDESATIYKIEKVFLLIQLLGSSIFVTKALISELLNFFLHFVSLICVIHKYSYLTLDSRSLVVNASFSETLKLELRFFFRRKIFSVLSILNFAGTFLFRFESWSDSDAKVVR